jgi:hypothetical protein
VALVLLTFEVGRMLHTKSPARALILIDKVFKLPLGVLSSSHGFSMLTALRRAPEKITD